MRQEIIVLVLLFVSLAFSFNIWSEPSSGGGACVACDVVIFVMKQTALQEELPIEDVVKGFCARYLNGTWIQEVCDVLMNQYGSDIIQLLVDDVDTDDICQTIRICGNKTCRLYPKREEGFDSAKYDEVSARHAEVEMPFQLQLFAQIPMPWSERDVQDTSSSQHSEEEEALPNPHDPRFNPLDYIEQIVDRVFAKHLPLFDFDNDTFSTYPTFRGSNWRGKDCHDMDSSVYPGRSQSSHPVTTDHNCNGIWGADQQSGKSYEELYCAQSQPRGIAILGDSAGAHFHVPNQKLATPDGFATLAENEADYPHCSWSTGYETTAQCPSSPWSNGMDSIYLRMRERNRCNHRDYVSVAVNGARSSGMTTHVMSAYTRDIKNDNPVMMFYALVGNDVCNPHPGMSHMTQPADFEHNIIVALDYLATKLPAGSHVFFVGLQDGAQWDIMAERAYPSLNTTYAALWEFVSCLGINPCWGWLNPDPYWRNYTINLAAQLNAVFPKIVAEQKYANFDLHYLGNHQRANINSWVASGGEAWQMLEWIGGGHPSQLNHEMDVEALWNAILEVAPEALGPVNPHNADIEKLFGDQGGY
eukprot:TRINITY_DN8044_c0_g1_i1.p1 TRINITY_DN8044_c0_g1~~TRINITY_DN8044_c0_g1_i1.p1  ORF type:complete len:587 (+),score=106.89 TRINITY_DN8044_c0_g1_i1:57-1817(+)